MLNSVQVSRRERPGGEHLWRALQPRRDQLRCYAERGGFADTIFRLQPVAPQHVPVPDGQADHGNALAGMHLQSLLLRDMWHFEKLS